jgi:hypothetical protein
MDIQEFIDGLTALGFTDGYAIGNEPAEIILWENEAKQPTAAAIAKAAPEGAYIRELNKVKELRRIAYQAEADPIFFQAQREDTYTLQNWKDKVKEIDERYPNPKAP